MADNEPVNISTQIPTSTPSVLPPTPVDTPIVSTPAPAPTSPTVAVVTPPVIIVTGGGGGGGSVAPINTTPASHTMVEDSFVTFSGATRISVSDSDTPNLTVSLSSAQGVISLSGIAGLTFNSGDGTSDAFMQFSGTQAAINAALNNLVFTGNADFAGAATLSVTTFDGVLTTSSSVAITVTGVNDAPALSGVSATVTYLENLVNVTPQLIDNSVTLGDVDAPANFNGGNVTVALTSGNAEDQLTIRNQGSGAGQIGVAGANISYGGTLIGTAAGGANGATLTITLNASATVAATQALIENLLYANTSDTPFAARTATITVNDGQGGTSVGQAVTINVTPEVDSGNNYTLTGANDSPGNTIYDDTYFTTGANFNLGDTIAAGAGSDIIRFTNAANFTAADLANKTGIDVIQLTANGNVMAFNDAFIDAADNTSSIEIQNGTFTIT